MRGIGGALAWEFWRRGRWWFALASAALVCPPALHYHIVRRIDPAPSADLESWSTDVYSSFFAVAMFAAVWCALYAANENRSRFPKRLFTAPAPAWSLVMWKMLLGAVGAAAVYLVSMALANLLFGFMFPLWAPALSAFVLYCCVAAGAWSWADFRLAKAAAWQLVLVSLVVWIFKRFHPDGWSEPARAWTTPTILEFLTMAAYVAAACAFALIEVARDRSGSFRDWPDLQRCYEWATAWLFRRGGHFRSPLAAERWRQWRPQGLVAPGIAVLLVAVIVIVAICSSLPPDPHEPLSAESPTVMLFIVPAFAAFVIGVQFGHKQSRRKSELEGFTATRPLSDSALAGVVLKAGATSTALTWAATLLGAAILAGWLVWFEGRDPLSQFFRSGPEPSWKPALWLVLPAASLLLAWTIMALAASLFLTGRNWLIIAVVAILLAWPYPYLFLVLMGWHQMLRWLAVVYFLAVAVGMLAGTAWMYAAALRNGMVSLRTAWLAFVTWAAPSAAVAAIACWSRPDSVMSLVLLAGLFALPLAPLAAAPLALSWNRHR